MAHWTAHVFGPQNQFKPCPSCKTEVSIEELYIWDGACRACRAVGRGSNEKANSVDNIR